jgi:hypothetical protein
MLTWKQALKVLGTGGMSFLDQVSDVYVSYNLFRRGAFLYGGILVGCVGLSMILMITGACINEGGRKRECLERIILILLGLNTGETAFRVATKQEKKVRRVGTEEGVVEEIRMTNT